MDSPNMISFRLDGLDSCLLVVLHPCLYIYLLRLHQKGLFSIMWSSQNSVWKMKWTVATRMLLSLWCSGCWGSHCTFRGAAARNPIPYRSWSTTAISGYRLLEQCAFCAFNANTSCAFHVPNMFLHSKRATERPCEIGLGRPATRSLNCESCM